MLTVAYVVKSFMVVSVVHLFRSFVRCNGVHRKNSIVWRLNRKYVSSTRFSLP